MYCPPDDGERARPCAEAECSRVGRCQSRSPLWGAPSATHASRAGLAGWVEPTGRVATSAWWEPRRSRRVCGGVGPDTAGSQQKASWTLSFSDQLRRCATRLLGLRAVWRTNDWAQVIVVPQRPLRRALPQLLFQTLQAARPQPLPLGRRRLRPGTSCSRTCCRGAGSAAHGASANGEAANFAASAATLAPELRLPRGPASSFLPSPCRQRTTDSTSRACCGLRGMARPKAVHDTALAPLLATLVLACWAAVRLDTAQPVSVASTASAQVFSAARAVDTARLLTAQGPRPAGSPAEGAAFQVRGGR